MSEIPQKMPRSGPTRSTTDVNRTKPYIRPAKPQKKANNQPHSDKDVGVESGFSPSASESSSSDEDDGSVFAPDNPIDETTSLAHTNDLKRSMMDGYEEDLKPTIEFSEDEKDIKPALKNGQRSASPKKTPTKHIKTESASSPTPSPKKNGPKGAKAAPRTWTAEEDWSLFKELHPKVDKPNWGGVAGIIGNGRDAKIDTEKTRGPRRRVISQAGSRSENEEEKEKEEEDVTVVTVPCADTIIIVMPKPICGDVQKA